MSSRRSFPKQEVVLKQHSLEVLHSVLIFTPSPAEQAIARTSQCAVFLSRFIKEEVTGLGLDPVGAAGVSGLFPKFKPLPRIKLSPNIQ